eukprot:scaffold316258_cov32-Tisochrysis_lutea.AAC.3
METREHRLALLSLSFSHFSPLSSLFSPVFRRASHLLSVRLYSLSSSSFSVILLSKTPLSLLSSSLSALSLRLTGPRKKGKGRTSSAVERGKARARERERETESERQRQRGRERRPRSLWLPACPSPLSAAVLFQRD